MIISVDKKIYFHGIPSTPLQRRYLRERGFIHVTGIKVTLQGIAYHIGERLNAEELGQWNSRDDLTVITLPCGEIWLRSGFYEMSKDEAQFLQLKGRGGYVPFGSGEFLHSAKDLLARFIDPNAGLSFKE